MHHAPGGGHRAACRLSPPAAWPASRSRAAAGRLRRANDCDRATASASAVRVCVCVSAAIPFHATPRWPHSMMHACASARLGHPASSIQRPAHSEHRAASRALRQPRTSPRRSLLASCPAALRPGPERRGRPAALGAIRMLLPPCSRRAFVTPALLAATHGTKRHSRIARPTICTAIDPRILIRTPRNPPHVAGAAHHAHRDHAPRQRGSPTRRASERRPDEHHTERKASTCRRCRPSMPCFIPALLRALRASSFGCVLNAPRLPSPPL